jgi:hypothetical protein
MKAYPQDSDGKFMDLRDYFAARALAALIQRNTGSADSWVDIAYRYADAMMIAREKE